MKTVGWVVGVLSLVVAASASAQNDGQGAGRCADPCQACMNRIQGSGSGDDASCPNACQSCDRMRTAHSQAGASSGQAQGTGSSAQASKSSSDRSSAQAGQSSSQPQQGQNVAASLDQAGRSVSSAVSGATDEVSKTFGEAKDRGLQGVGPRQNTLVTDAIGTFTGIGLNAEYQRPLAQKLSGVVGAHYSRTNTVGGSATTFGLTVGGDYFLLGAQNQGLRIGPRAGVDFGGVSANDGDTNLDARLGLAGELGYNWMGSSGVSLQLALGAGGRVGGSVGGLNDQFGGDFGPYARVNLGWSW